MPTSHPEPQKPSGLRLSKLASFSHDHSTELCTVCEKLNWSALILGPCSKCSVQENLDHFHIGLWKEIKAKLTCPGCRLISAAVTWGNRQEDCASAGNRPVEIYRHRVHIEEVSSASIVPVRPVGGALRVVLRPNKDTLSAAIMILRKAPELPIRSFGDFPDLNLDPNCPGDCGSGMIVSSAVNFALMRQWIKVCDTMHKKCRWRGVISSAAPSIRLIDVEQQTVVSANLTERYIALSYVWGQDTMPLLRKDTLYQYTSPNGLKNIEIPRTIADAMKIAKVTGERYLWVDSLCIVQDDSRDKLQQLPIMADIYSRAHFVIVASAGNSAEAALPGMGSTTRLRWQQVETIHGITFTTAQPSLREALRLTTWSTRGWTFQESMLASRMLIFTEYQMFWQCRGAGFREDLHFPYASMSMRIEPEHKAQEPQNRDTIYPKSGPGTCRTAAYCSNVQLFTKRHFREQSDILWAFAGILKSLVPQFPQGYIWGLPKERLDATLLWDISCSRSTHARHSQHSVAVGKEPRFLPFPSWSWLSTSTPVQFFDPCGSGVVSEVQWLEPLETLDTASRYSESSLGLISPFAFSSSLDMMSYGLLQFIAKTAFLRVTLDTVSKEESSTSDPESEAQRLSMEEQSGRKTAATVHIPSGKLIGELLVPVTFFQGKKERLGEFILLSSNAEEACDKICMPVEVGLDCGSVIHAKKCKYIQSHNLMLIDWIGNVSYRCSIMMVDRKDWEEISTEQKHIVLG